MEIREWRYSAFGSFFEMSFFIFNCMIHYYKNNNSITIK